MEQGLCTFHEDDRIATTHLPETDCGCKLAVCQWCFDTFKATNKLGFRFPIKETFSEFLAMKNDEPVKYPHVGLPRDLTSEELANFESKTEQFVETTFFGFHKIRLRDVYVCPIESFFDV